ncbi:MAG: LEA type 2 family protein [Deltaproteobacteria bacterium]|nr:LEA type 2 family protein [Deltaproteobacteria bacterium]MBW2237498.1 LEA type 2 family protein [Deltaproteobacteria bacterium]MBW2571197.1 LEA type 2 family protein [Deltaproteobacteria bacterium]MBW2668363.1 LEA type 2 family protein [Deltaproteobacteria bacterium]
MHKRSFVLTCLSVVVIAAMLSGCAGMMVTPTQQNFKAPTVALSHVELEHYFGWWFYGKKVKPTKGKAGNNGAPLDFAFIYEITNPNDYPILLDGFSFSIALEEFSLNRAISPETMWIPPGKTNQLRVHALFDVRPAQLSLLVTGGFKLKEKGITFWDQLEKWWTGAPNFSYPISANEGSAIFKAGGITKVVPFNATFP